MKKLILFTLLPLFSFSQITWSWTDAETGLDKGTFVTNGTLNEDGTVSSGTYTISDFTLDQTSTPISTSGSFANGDWVLSQPDIGFIWSGSYVTEFWRSSGGYTNGLNIYTQGYTHGISMSIDYFAISQGEDNFLVSQSTTPLVAPLNSETDSDIKLNGTVSAESNQIKNVAEPTEAKDAATKGYVDNNVNSFSGSYNDLTDTPTTITNQQATDISTNSSKVTFPGFGTSAGTALAGDTSLFSGSYSDLTNTPLTITTQQASDIETNNAKISNAQVDWNANSGASAILNKPDVYFKEEIDLLIAQMQNQINTMQQELQNLKPYSTVAYDGFDYDQGTTLYNKSGGYGWSEAWDNDSSSQSWFSVRNMHYIINSSSSYGGVYSSSRRSEMTYHNLESVGNYLGNDDQQTDIACFSFRNLSESINSGVYYVQFLVQFNNFSDSDANGAKNNYFILMVHYLTWSLPDKYFHFFYEQLIYQQYLPSE